MTMIGVTPEQFCEKIAKLEKENQQLKRALKKYEEVRRFYGEDNVYRSKHGGHIENKNFKSKIGQDAGKKARELLNDNDVIKAMEIAKEKE